jgi:zinc transport system substrate-binding protein
MVKVHTLLRPGQGPHSFEPTPGAAKIIERSDILVMAGFGLDNWLEKLVKLGGNASGEIVDCSKVVKNQITGGSHNHGHGGVNPHYWLDPSIMADVVDLLGRRLASRIPDKADEIKNRAERVKADLLELDREIAAMLSESTTGFASIHNSWVYFARRYGLRQIGVIKKAPGREPSARYIAELAGKMKSSGARTVLGEPQFSARLGEMLANETGASVITVDPIGGVKGRDDYFKLMRWNAKRFYKALR